MEFAGVYVSSSHVEKKFRRRRKEPYHIVFAKAILIQLHFSDGNSRNYRRSEPETSSIRIIET